MEKHINKELVYTGIGSRETPADFLKLFRDVASHLGRLGYTLRSGGAQGADQAFEQGCDKVGGFKRIYLPWPKFENSTSTLFCITNEAFEFASKYHPGWSRLSQGAQKLHARNVYQVLGYNLDQKTKFIICYTKGGTGAGGTGQALRIAKDRNIPIFDAGRYKTMPEAHKALKEFLEKIEA